MEVKPIRKTLAVRVPTKELRDLRARAAASGQTLNDYVCELIARDASDHRRSRQAG